MQKTKFDKKMNVLKHYYWKILFKIALLLIYIWMGINWTLFNLLDIDVSIPYDKF